MSLRSSSARLLVLCIAMLVIAPAIASAQINVGTSVANTVRAYATLPATCTASLRNVAMKTGADAGLYWCSATNTWSKVDTAVTVPGSDTQCIFNDGGAFGADAGCTYNKTTDSLTLAGGLQVKDGLINSLGIRFTSEASGFYLRNVNTVTVGIAGSPYAEFRTTGLHLGEHSLTFGSAVNQAADITVQRVAADALKLADTIYGSTAANGDIRIRPTSNATKATSYAYLLDDGGAGVVIGSTPYGSALNVGPISGLSLSWGVTFKTDATHGVLIDQTAGASVNAAWSVYHSSGSVGVARVNWDGEFTSAKYFTMTTVLTAAPASGDCDDAAETNRFAFDSTNDDLYFCSGASGWRKIATTAP